MNGNKIYDYIPEPDPVTSDYVVACHYYPGWHKGGALIHNGFEHIIDYPERTPLLGYYEESRPEVTDWEIKWAVEHGINCFIYCWYRLKENMGKPVETSQLRLGHAIHEGLFQARYRNYIKFAIMWECQQKWGVAEDENDLIENLIPFWMNNYFKQPNYLKINNMPVLFVYDNQNCLFNTFGSPEKLKEVFEKCSEKAREYGFDGMLFSVQYNSRDIEKLDYYKECGYNSSFAYNWYIKENNLTEEVILDRQIELMNKRLGYDPYYSFLTCSVGWDPRPWQPIMKMYSDSISWVLSPEAWRKLLERVKGLAESMPKDSVGRSIIMLDNWNEWAEGHYISPHLKGGFKYLQAVREVLTNRDNLPDYRLPQTLELGPYEQE